MTTRPKTRTAQGRPPVAQAVRRPSPPGTGYPPGERGGEGTPRPLRRRDDPCIFAGEVLVLPCPRCPQHGDGGDWHLGELLHQVNRDRHPA